MPTSQGKMKTKGDITLSNQQYFLCSQITFYSQLPFKGKKKERKVPLVTDLRTGSKSALSLPFSHISVHLYSVPVSQPGEHQSGQATALANH